MGVGLSGDVESTEGMRCAEQFWQGLLLCLGTSIDGILRFSRFKVNAQMSFQSEARIVRDEAQPLGRRYISLRHCVQMFSPIGFGETWDLLAAMTDLKENEPNTSAVLVSAVDLLSEWRRLHMHREAAQRAYVQGLVKLGLPKRLAGKLGG